MLILFKVVFIMTDPYAALWIVIAAVLILIEAATFNLVSIWVALGALAALVVAKLGYSLGLQIGVFFVVSLVLLAFTIPLTRRFLKPKKEATNADRIVGADGIVIEDIDPVNGTGQIKVMGGVWSARASDGSSILKGEHVKVVSIEGVKAIVIKKEA